MTSMPPPRRSHQGEEEQQQQGKGLQEATSYRTNTVSYTAVPKFVSISTNSEKQQQKMNKQTDDRDDDDTNVVKQPRVVVMKRSPSQFTDDGESSLFMSTSSGRAKDSEGEEDDDEGESSQALEKDEEALAALSALAGENVYDSPTPTRRKDVLTDLPKTNGGDNLRNQMSLPSLEMQHQQRHQGDEEEELSDDGGGGGIVASGWAWLRRSRESSRRKYLQKEAEKQLQKIQDAEMSRMQQHQNGNNNGSSSQPSSPELKNPTFLQMRNFDGATKAKPKLHRKLSDGSCHVTTTESGEGASAHLDWDALQISEDGSDQSLVPQVRIAEESSGGNASPYILTPEQMHEIAINVLPSSVSYCKWKRIYGLGRDGDSFDGCLRKIDSVSRTLMVVRTTRNEVFGGYADSSWNPHAIHRSQFYGGAGACLFKIQKNNNGKHNNSNRSNGEVVVNVYHWTGKNRYIQLCDMSRKMLAFGGGGDDGVFGLAVEEDFQKGSTGPCDTFDNEQLCSDEVFEIVDVEFWGFLTGMF